MAKKLIKPRKFVGGIRNRNEQTHKRYNQDAFKIVRPDPRKKLASSGTLPFDMYPKMDPYNDDTRQVITYKYKGKTVKIIIKPFGGGFMFDARVGRIKTARRWASVRTQAFIKYYDLIDQTNQWIDKGYV